MTSFSIDDVFAAILRDALALLAKAPQDEG